VGELFCRLASTIALSKVVTAAAALLAPHQYAVGVSCGAERIVHALQHSLTDDGAKLALLKVVCLSC
jgi:type IV secretory pathway VirB2 component (pilin)